MRFDAGAQQLQPKGRHYRCRASSGGSVVLVDEAAEAVMTVNRAADWPLAGARRLRRAQVERAVRPLTVVVVRVDAKDVLEVAPVQDQQPVEALRADGANESLSDRVRLRAYSDRAPSWRRAR